MFRCPSTRPARARASGGGRMVDDGGVPPLPRRVPGASGSPRATVRVDLGVISEDLRQRVLTAIATELERDEAERRRNAQGQGEAGERGSYDVFGTEPASRVSDVADDSAAALGEDAARLGDGAAGLGNGAADLGDIGPAIGYGVRPANGSGPGSGNGSGAGLDNGASTGWGHLTSGSSDYGVSASPEDASPW